MMWFVVYESGRCNDGDHRNGVKVFPSREEATAYIEEYRSVAHDSSFVVIHGYLFERRERP